MLVYESKILFLCVLLVGDAEQSVSLSTDEGGEMPQGCGGGKAPALINFSLH